MATGIIAITIMVVISSTYPKRRKEEPKQHYYSRFSNLPNQ